MQIFLSHSSRQKPLVREIRKCLPAHLASWIDEEKLLFGDNVAASIEQTIIADTDYVLLFIDAHAAASDWVRRELAWTLEAELANGRTFLLPVALEETAVYQMGNSQLAARKFLTLKDFQESSVRALGDSIASELFALVCRDVHTLRAPKPRSRFLAVADGERIVREQAALIQKAIFPHRRGNPISKDTLLRVINSQVDEPLNQIDFDMLLAGVLQRNLIPGLDFDGFDMFLVEEHASWKAAIHEHKKELIAKRAATYIQNGQKLFLDAGSTTEQIVKILCRRIESRAITRLTIATTSINIADIISDCCVRMGFDDDFSAVKLFIPGGQVRPGTQAIVPLLDEQRSQIGRLADVLDGFDLAIVGVNGVDAEAGFTTHENAESLNKIAMMLASRRRVIVGDSSKIGIKLERKFSDFGEDILFVVDHDKENVELEKLANTFTEKIVLV